MDFSITKADGLVVIVGNGSDWFDGEVFDSIEDAEDALESFLASCARYEDDNADWNAENAHRFYGRR